jgi:hypothetical protein
MSSFDPPLSRTSAAILAIGAALVLGWVLYSARHAPAPAPAAVGSGVVRP